MSFATKLPHMQDTQKHNKVETYSASQKGEKVGYVVVRWCSRPDDDSYVHQFSIYIKEEILMFEKIRKTNRYSREFNVKDLRAEKKRRIQADRKAARQNKLVGTAYDPAVLDNEVC